jgi:DNA-binding XRE family transcriptional regulator
LTGSGCRAAARSSPRGLHELPAPVSRFAALPPGQGHVRALTARDRPRLPDSYVIDGPRLRQLRRQHGLSQEKLAWDSGVGLTTLARLERQTRPRCSHWTLTRLGEDPATITAPHRNDTTQLL